MNIHKPFAHKLRIAYAPTMNNVPVDPEVARLVRAAAGRLDRFGIVEEVSFSVPALVW